MTRILPHPLLTLALVLMWLMLTRFTLGHLILGTAIALLAARVFSKLEPGPVGMRRIVPLIRLAAIVGYDIIRSNYAVALLILTRGRHGQRRSAFLEIPLRTRNPAALALLAMIVTVTPGTAWIEYDVETGIVVLHIFDLIDEEEWRAIIRDRYEALLLEAFA